MVDSSLPIALPETKFSTADFPGAREVSIPRGKFVLFEGEGHRDDCYLIVEGTLDVRLVTSSGHETLLYRLEVGDLVGELSMFGQQTRTASILAANPCRLLHIPRTLFQTRFQDSDFNARIMALFLHRYLKSHDVICRLGQPTIATKLCRYLLSLPEWSNSTSDKLIIQLGSHQELAQMLSCQRETVTRAFKVLQKFGILENLENRTYRINRNTAQLFMDDEA